MQDRRQRYLSGTVLGRSGQRALYSEPSLVQVEPLKRSARQRAWTKHDSAESSGRTTSALLMLLVGGDEMLAGRGAEIDVLDLNLERLSFGSVGCLEAGT